MRRELPVGSQAWCADSREHWFPRRQSPSSEPQLPAQALGNDPRTAMMSNNVMSFMKKMVKSGTDDSVESRSVVGANPLYSKIKATVQEITLGKAKPAMSHLTDAERDILQRVFQKEEEFEKETQTIGRKPSTGVLGDSSEYLYGSERSTPQPALAGTCRSCRKGLGPSEQHYVCIECLQLVCDDCASYSKRPNEHCQGWKCGFCRRRNQDRMDLPPGSGMHRVPSVRRMAEKMAHGLRDDIHFSDSEVTHAALERRASHRPMVSTGSDEIFRPRGPSLSLMQGLTMHHSSGEGSLDMPTLRGSRSEVQVDSTTGYPLSRHRSDEAKRGGSMKSDSNLPRASFDKTNRPPSEGRLASEARPSSPLHSPSYSQHPSSEVVGADRRSSSESQAYGAAAPLRSPSRQGSGNVSRASDHHSSREKRHSHHYSGGSHHGSQKYSSPSGSSNEDISNESDEERRRKNRPRRKSKLLRQKGYMEDGDSDPVYPVEEWKNRAGAFNSSLESNSALDSFENDREVARRLKSGQLHLPTQGSSDKPIRHIASDAVLYVRRHSSESSDVSDVSGDYSTHSECSGGNTLHDHHKKYSGDSLTCHTSQRAPRKVYRHHRRQNSESEAKLSPHTIDSTPSPDDVDQNRLSADNSFSIDDQEILGEGGKPDKTGQRDIPFVLVDNVGDHRRKPSYDFIYPPIDLSRRSSTGRALPKVPDNPGTLFPVLAGRTRSTHSLDIPREELGLTERRASAPEGETIKIVIDDVDSGQPGARPRQSRHKCVLLHRDPKDEGARTKGFGLRVMGGKVGEDGRLYAQISWTVPGGPADLGGLKQGDRIIEWNGMSLVDLTYEEVSIIMDRTGDTVELLIETILPTGSDQNINRTIDARKKSAPCSLDSYAQPEPEVPQVHSTGSGRRKLPKTPDQLCQDNMQGEVGVQIWFDQSRSNLLVTLIGARGLRRRRSSSGALPRPYCKIRLIPHTGHSYFKTPLSEPCVNPEWNKTFVFPGVTSDNVLEKMLDISIWDNSSQASNIFLGEAQVPLRRADLQDCPEWYPLSIHQAALLSPPLKAPPPNGNAPTASMLSTPAHDYARRLLKKVPQKDPQQKHSLSEDKNEELYLDEDGRGMIRSSSMDSTFLSQPEQVGSRTSDGESMLQVPGIPERKTSVPNVAYMSVPGQQVNGSVSMPRSTPTSRRNSQLVAQDSLPELYSSDMKGPDRMRSSSLRVHRQIVFGTDPDLGSGNLSSDSSLAPPPEGLEQRRLSTLVKQKLSRTLSLKTDSKDKRSVSLGSGSTERWTTNYRSPDDTPDSESPSQDDPDESPTTTGPGQVLHRKYSEDTTDWERLGHIKLGLVMTKGQLEVDIVGGKGLKMNPGGQLPDTYVKTYLKDGDRKLQKRKTRVVRHSTEPQYRQTLKYNASDISGRVLLVMVWERQKGFEHNQPIGAAEVQLDRLDLTKLTIGWFRLFPLTQMDLESQESN